MRQLLIEFLDESLFLPKYITLGGQIQHKTLKAPKYYFSLSIKIQNEILEMLEFNSIQVLTIHSPNFSQIFPNGG